MGKIKLLTPLHIGSGNKYYVLETNNKRLITLEDALSVMYIDEYTPELYNKLMKQNPGKKEIRSIFNNKNVLKRIKIDEKEEANLTCCSSVEGYVEEFVKEAGEYYIPGSSIKGYIKNVLWYDVVKKNSNIKKVLLEKITRNNVFSEYDRSVSLLLNFLGFRDLKINSKITYGVVNRYSKKNSAVPQGTLEIFDNDTEINGEIIIDNSILYNKLDEYYKELSKKDDINIVFEFYKRIKNFKEWFVKANREFMQDILSREEEYARENENLNIANLQDIYNQLQTINNEKVLIRLGKYTNFLVKTSGIAFGADYDKNFAFFKPNKKRKNNTSSLDYMTLVENNGKGTYPLGYAIIEF